MSEVTKKEKTCCICTKKVGITGWKLLDGYICGECSDKIKTLDYSLLTCKEANELINKQLKCPECNNIISGKFKKIDDKIICKNCVKTDKNDKKELKNSKSKDSSSQTTKKIGTIVGGIFILIVLFIGYNFFFAPSKLSKEYPGVKSFTVKKEWNGFHTKVLGHYGVLEYTHLTDQEIVDLCEKFFPTKNLYFVMLQKAPEDVYGYHIVPMSNPKTDLISEGYIGSDDQAITKPTYFVAITKDNKIGRMPWTPNPVKEPSNWE